MAKSKFFSGFSLKATDSEVHRQIEYYDTLKPWQSFRGISAILLSLSAVLTIIFSYFQIVPIENVWLDIVMMLVLALFVYRGSKVALMLAGIYWTLVKGIALVERPGQLLVIILWWYLFASYFYKAWQVEKARVKPKA